MRRAIIAISFAAGALCLAVLVITNWEGLCAR